jgi:hypothetical protein
MTGWVDVEDEELLAAISATQRECNAAEARMLLVIAELDHRGLAAERGYKDTVDLLQTMQRVSVGTAKDRVRVARKTTPERTLQGEELSAAMPATGAALGAAEISFEHARVIERTLAALPAHLVADHAEALERDLAEHARVLDPNALRKLGKHALVLLDPDGARPRDGAPVRNRLRFTPRGAGFELRGWFDQECTAILRTAISPLAAPTDAHQAAAHQAGAHEAGACEERGCDHETAEPETAEPEPDRRSAAERDGDALVELARRMMSVGELPVEGGTRPQVTVTISLDNLRGSGAGLLEAGDGIGRGVVRSEDARRIACDAGIIPILPAPTGNPSMSAASIGSCTPPSGGRSAPGMAGARSLDAVSPPAGRTPITSAIGPTAGRPHSRTPCCCVPAITGSCTTRNGR